jgi:BirA family biotin operon repressor/biotin-[acetyl-CoA-carboxylase] ligase
VSAPPVYRHPTLGSTNDEARRLAEGGVASGAAVVADAQTAGRGRRGAAWQTLPGEHVFLSVVHRPRGPLARVSGVTLDVAVAVAEALAALGAGPRVKWPNDLLVTGRKVAGILCELTGATADTDPAVIVGVGVDCNASVDALPDDLADIATTLSIALGETVDVRALTDDLIARVRAACVAYDDRGGPDVAAFASWSDTIGARVRTHDGREGRATGVASDGALNVAFDDGDEEAVRAGAVTILTD